MGQSVFVGARYTAPLRQSHLKFTTCTIGYITNGAYLDFVIVLVQEIKFGSSISDRQEFLMG